MTSISADGSRGGVRLQVVGVCVVAVAAAAVWWVWLGWDRTYQVDPVTDVRSGPYEAWQVVGVALSLLALYLGALWAGVRPVYAGIALTLAFTVAWTLDAAARDDTGLFGVGTLLLSGGLGTATTVVGLVTTGVRARLAARRAHAGPAS